MKRIARALGIRLLSYGLRDRQGPGPLAPRSRDFVEQMVKCYGSAHHMALLIAVKNAPAQLRGWADAIESAPPPPSFMRVVATEDSCTTPFEEDPLGPPIEPPLDPGPES